MRLLSVVLVIAGLTVSNSAYAWFFFFIPGGATRAIADSFTGAKGKICVKEGTQVGQILTSGNGNTAKVLSLSGTSSICPNPALPIRAELEFTYNFSSKAGIELSDDFQPSTVTDLEMFNGTLMKAASKSTRNHGVMISATTKKANVDIETLANNMERMALNNPRLKDVASARTEKLTIKGLPALRFEISGTLSGIFGQRIVYQYTIIGGEREIVAVNVYAPVDYMESNRRELQKISEQVRGLDTTEQVMSPPAASAPPTPSASTETVPAPAASAPVAPTRMAPADQSTPSPVPQSSSLVAPPIVYPIESAATDKSSSAEQRLQRLSKLLKEGVITESEFNAKKLEILKDL